MSAKLNEQRKNRARVPVNLLPHLYKKGQSGNPNGRPKGSISLKQYAKQMLEKMTPEEREEYLQGLPKQFIWEMAEGKAETKATVEATIDHKLVIDPKAESLLDEVISGTN